MVITAAYTGLRWGELAGLQWIRIHLDEDTPHIDIDPKFGALHEIRRRLELGSPQTPASVRTVHLPPFLADELRTHRARNPDTRFVFTGVDGGLHRRSKFRRRVWLPALTGDEEKGWSPLNQNLHFHDLRHTHETWLIEDRVPRIMRLVRLGHKRKDVDDIYSHGSAGRAPHLLLKITDGPPMKIIDRPPELGKHTVGDTGIEPVTSSV